MEREAEETRRREHAQLDSDLRSGRITQQMYKLKKKAIDR
jgi:hypothetical protein